MKNHRIITIFAACFTICICAVCALSYVGRTNAFYTGTDSVKNQIDTENVRINVEEDVKGLSKTRVEIENPSKSPCYVRMKVMIPVIEGLNSTPSSQYEGFVEGDDGFYYLNRILSAGDSVVLGSDKEPFYSASFAAGIDNDEERKRIASLADVVIYVEAVQADYIVENAPEGTAEAAMEAFAKLRQKTDETKK